MAYRAAQLALLNLTATTMTAAGKPTPQISSGKYGPHDRNEFDLWQAKADGTRPLVVFFHGGGFVKGSRSTISAVMLERLLASGISVMAADYRLTPEVHFPEHYHDCARAIQFARANAQEWNIEPTQIGAFGSSAGGCAALWLAFHDDLADTDSDDPVLRQSSRLRGVAVFSAQSSLDPELVGKHVGPTAKHYLLHKAGSFLGVERSDLQTSRVKQLITDASPVRHLSKDDPSVWAFYREAELPLPPTATPSQAIHHIGFGLYLRDQMEKLGLECEIVTPEDRNATMKAATYFQRQFQAK